MEIDETINQWFAETQSLMNNQGYRETDPLDLRCIAILRVLDNYLKNTLLILNNGGRLSAKALLRISGEFVTKFLWCIRSSKRQNPDIAKENFDRWLKSSLNHDQELRKKMLSCFDKEKQKKLLERINIDQTQIDSIKYKCMPDFTEVFKNVFGTINTIEYGGIYLRFLNSVHIDLRTISDTIEKKNNIIFCKGDEAEDNVKQLKIDCLISAYMFLKGLYDFYELCFENIEKEYDQILKNI